MPTDLPQFRDRREAGRRLARALLRFRSESPLVLALPRGGVPVGYEIATALGAEFDVLLVRKIGAPGQPELGLGALVDGTPPLLVLNDDIVAAIRPPPGYIAAEQAIELAELARRRTAYRGGRPPVSVAGRTVIVVDDGIATGGTVRAALKALAQAGAARTILAVPVAPPEALAELRLLADDVVCLATPHPFRAVGLHYENFSQTTDEEVVALLAACRTGPVRTTGDNP